MISVLLRTADYRGDHSADVAIAQELLPCESVEHAALRLLVRPTDVLEVRLVVQTGDPEAFKNKD